ncbi:hypothetical protein MATL_G00229850 [Megalops atlanticus]|uniref:C-type lectin domain-containing protein n=1 Tax=Megalops atlanticus TaxID=7932 RepID=A0A9D3PF05_MEGAT|nr:hypothetical protein MATL_G00229850 [Megalops atlanticus]
MSDEVCYSTVIFANPGTSANDVKKEEETTYAQVMTAGSVQTVPPTGSTEKKEEEEEIPYADVRSEQTAPPPGTLKEKTEAEAERDILNQTYTMLLQYFPVESYCPVQPGTQERMCGRCLPGWRLLESSCYYFSTERKNWTDSRAGCRKLDADLVIIENLAEQTFINETIVSYDGQTWSHYWIGATDTVNETVWVWVDYTLMTTSYWASTEGNNTPDEDCGTIIKSQQQSGKWYDNSCSNSYRWICESRALKGPD